MKQKQMMKQFAAVFTAALLVFGVANADNTRVPALFGGGTVTSPIVFPLGTASNPSITFVGDENTGIYQPAALPEHIFVTTAGTAKTLWNTVQFQMPSTYWIGWSSGAVTGGIASDTIMLRDAAGIPAVRNGTTATGFRVYNTFTDASNYERIANEWNTNIAILGARAAGTGTFRGTRVYGSVVSIFTGATDGAAAATLVVNPTNIDIGSTAANQSLNFLGTGTAGALITSATADSGGTDVGYEFQVAGNLGVSPDLHTRWTDNGGGANLMRLFGDGALNVTGALTAGAVFTAPLYSSTTNCSSSAAPAVCSAAPAGSVVIAAAGTTVTVNTTAVTANSQIFIQEDSSLGTKLSVTCNTTTGRDYTVTARTASTSFVITASAAPVTNPACLSYFIVN